MSIQRRLTLVLITLLSGVVLTPGTGHAAFNHNVNGNTVVLLGDLVPDRDTQSLADAQAVANLTVAHHPQKIIHLGDLQYECGTLGEFNRSSQHLDSGGSDGARREADA